MVRIKKLATRFGKGIKKIGRRIHKLTRRSSRTRKPSPPEEISGDLEAPPTKAEQNPVVCASSEKRQEQKTHYRKRARYDKDDKDYGPNHFLKPNQEHTDVHGSKAESFPTENKPLSDLFGKDVVINNDDAKGKATDEIDNDPESPPMLPQDDNPMPPFKFVDHVPEDLVCPVCLETLRNPTLTSCCGHRFCFQCIHQVLSTSDQCPMCRTSGITKLVDKRTQDKIDELTVHCEVAGCSWIGNYRDLRGHNCLDAMSLDSPLSAPTPPAVISPASTHVEAPHAPSDGDLDTDSSSRHACKPKRRHKTKRKMAKVSTDASTTSPTPQHSHIMSCARKMRKGKQHCERLTKRQLARAKRHRAELSLQRSTTPPQSKPAPEKILSPKDRCKGNKQIKGPNKPARKKRKKAPQQPRPGRDLKSSTKEKRRLRRAERAAEAMSVQRGFTRYVERRPLGDSLGVGTIPQLAVQAVSPCIASGGSVSSSSGSSSTKSKRSGTGSHGKKAKRRSHSRVCSSSRSTSRGTSSGNAGDGSESEDEHRERKNPHRHELQQDSSESDTDSSDLETSDHEETEHPQPQSPSLSPRPSLPAVAEPSTKNGTAERKFSATVPCLPHRGSKGPPRSQSFPSDKGTKDDIVSGTAPTKPPVSESNPQSEGCELVVPTGKTFKRLYPPSSSIAPGFSSLHETPSQSIALPPALKSFAASSPTQPVGKGNQRCAFARASQDRSYCAEKSRPVAGISRGRKNPSGPVERSHQAEKSRLVMGTSRRENSSVNVCLASCTVEVKVFEDGVGLHPSQLGGTRIQVFLISCARKADLQGLLKVLKSLIECRVIYRDRGLPFSLCPPAVWIVPGDSTEEHCVTLERTGCTLHQDCTAFVESLVEILDLYERTRSIFSCGQSERGGVTQFFRSCCDEVVLYGDVLDEEALLKIVAMILRE